jgi:dipicolinate synthase subunit B
MEIGFAMCGSFCTYDQVFPVMEAIAKEHHVIPIFSFAASSIDSRFGTALEHLEKARSICGRSPLQTTEGTEPIGLKNSWIFWSLLHAPGIRWLNWPTP